MAIESKENGFGSLAREFMLPPFSVLNAREGAWQERKAYWLAMGIESELGRFTVPGGNLMPGVDPATGKIIRVDNKGRALKKDDRAYESQGWVQDKGLQGLSGSQTGASIFDPTLCEVIYRWFSGPDQMVLDPFAGGSVRGIVASKLGRRYMGIELRKEQVEANRRQKSLCDEIPYPCWICGDSLKVTPALDIKADLIFSCPPYGDLEFYSDEEGDLSNMTHDDFLASYRGIIAASVAKLKPDRFAVFVVGDYRDKKTGCYRNFVGETVSAFEAAGALFYNEAILVTALGSLPIRVRAQFTLSRKLGKTHQNVLVFCKGDPKKATAACGPVTVPEVVEKATDQISLFDMMEVA